MIIQTEVTVMVDSIEFDILHRVEPSVRVGFPTGEIEDAGRQERQGDPRHRVKAARNQWAGRHLNGVCSRRDRFTADTIHNAWAQLSHLIEVLTEQSTREYWEKALAASKPLAYGDVVAPGPSGTSAGGVSLVAPGTDVVGMLTETREQMLHIAQAAVPVLQAAVDAVGPRREVMNPADLDARGI